MMCSCVLVFCVKLSHFSLGASRTRKDEQHGSGIVVFEELFEKSKK